MPAMLGLFFFCLYKRVVCVLDPKSLAFLFKITQKIGKCFLGKLKYVPCAPFLEVGMFDLELFQKYVLLYV